LAAGTLNEVQLPGVGRDRTLLDPTAGQNKRAQDVLAAEQKRLGRVTEMSQAQNSPVGNRSPRFSRRLACTASITIHATAPRATSPIRNNKATISM
jgi:hypothetical protein